MKISRYILYTTRLLNDRDIPVGKTVIQKMLYFLSGEKRTDHFKAYLYGPYSKSVDITIESLLAAGDLRREGNRLVTDLAVRTDSADAQRVTVLVSAVADRGLTTSATLANTAKVHMFHRDSGKTDDELVEFIRQRSRFLGWKELGELPPDTIKEFLKHAQDLDALLARCTS
jgi:hypothetical protein